MSVSELLKSAIPVAAIHHQDAASTGTLTKFLAITTTAPTTTTTPTITNVASNSNNIVTPLRSKNQQSITNNTEKLENVGNNSGKSKICKTNEEFYKDLQHFHDRRNTPIAYMPKISGRTVDLHGLYTDVTERGGFHKVNNRDEWDEVLPIVGLRDKCVNACAAVKQIYRRYLEKYERLTFFGEDPDKMEALEAAEVLDSGRSRSSRYPTHGFYNSGVNAVPMAYNYRQHIVNMERRRTFHLSTDLHKHSNYEKLALSLISPLPNEQDFAINVCTLMANENKQTLKLTEYPKLLDLWLAHVGVFSDYTLRKLFEQTYVKIRRHSLFAFWRDLLHDKPQILDLYTDEQSLKDAMLIDDEHITNNNSNFEDILLTESLNMDFLNLGREHGTQDFVGQRVLQILNILRHLSFFDENLTIFAKNRTFLRFVVMSANVRWGNIHIQALDIAGNVATDVELCDPSLDDLSRSLMATLCDGIEGADRAVIISCLEILYKLCQKDSNEDYINKCLNQKFYETVCLFLSLNDIMLIIFTLETIYALTSMGTRSCQLLMQVRGIIDQLVSLISVEAQSYGPDGCILMRVVETVPGNMLPMVAQNIANIQNTPVIQPPQQQQQPAAAAATATASTIPLKLSTQVAVAATIGTTVIVQHAQSNTEQIHQLANNCNGKNEQQQLQKTIPQQQVASVPTTTVVNTSQQQQQQQNQQSVINATTVAATTPTSSTATNMNITTTTPPPPAPSPTMTTSNQFTKDDEQYALAWLAATFERVTGIEHRIEQQEMYRQYLQHCQKSGKHSIVNHIQFPRLVRVIFGNNVGPAIVRRADGTEYAGIHYVAIKHRAPPLTIQEKVILTTAAAAALSTSTTTLALTATTVGTHTSTATATTTTTLSNINMQKLIKKPMQQQLGESSECYDASIPKSTPPPTTTPPQPPPPPPSFATSSSLSAVTINTKPIITSNIQLAAAQPHTLQQQQQQPSTSLIKSLLANKVTQRQQKQKDIVTQANIINQQLQHQHHQQTPIKVTSNTISALVNNPLMQNTPVKVGQTTIKPLNPQLAMEKKHLIMETSSAPPPLAPLSGHNVAIKDNGRSVIISNQMLAEILDKKGGEPPIPATIIKRKLDDSNLSGLGIDSPNIKRLAYDANGSVIAIVSNTNNNNTVNINHGMSREELGVVAPSRNAANLYAEMAASILEDEDLEDIPTLLTHSAPLPTLPPPSGGASNTSQQSILNVGDSNSTMSQKHQQSMLMPAKMQQNTVSIPMQRQILFQTSASNQGGQLKLTTNTGQPTTMATIKTDQGLQTLPVILQQKPMDSTPPQLVLQQQQTPHTTQYVLATNQQGQTYLVAQQTTAPAPPPPTQQPTQTVLVTQTPQQHSTGTKTIIILQQQTLPTGQGTQQTQLAGGQKMIMTTQQGQSLLVTQRSGNTPVSTPTPPPPSPIIINPGTGNLTSTMLHRQLQLHQQQQHHHQQQQQQSTSGQISPTLLSQLNHIPATIKLHQPSSVITSNAGNTMNVGGSTATITRVTKPMSMMHQQQQQQQQQQTSLIQQHILSGASTEKRQVILTGSGRAIEIKETVIQQQQQQQQQQSTGVQTALLNSQTIITHSPRALLDTATPPLSLASPSSTLTSSVASVATTSMQQQKPTNITVSSVAPLTTSNVYIQSKPTLSLTTTLPTTTTTSVAQNATQVMMAGKKTAVIARSISQTMPGVIKSSTLLTSSTGNSTLSGPPPLAMPSNVAQEIQNQQQQQQQQKNDDVLKTSPCPTPTTTPTPPLRTPTPTTTAATTIVAAGGGSTTTIAAVAPAAMTNITSLPAPVLNAIDANWLYICDWRNCARRKFKSINDLQHHVCTVHCPDHLDPAAEIFCQWGTGPNLCDGIPRKRFSLMTHLIDRHITVDSLRQSVQRRLSNVTTTIQSTQQPVTIIRNMNDVQRAASPSSGTSGALPTMGSSALQAIKRHTADFNTSKELMEENEGPVTKSIRLTAALILRNLVTYTNTAKRSLRRFEPHLSNIALSNVESSGTVSHILFELNN